MIDLDKRAIISNIRVGTAQGWRGVTPDGRTVVVSNRESDTASIIDGTQLQVRATLSICQGAGGILVLQTLCKAFVVCSGSGQIASIDLKSDKVLALLDVGRTPVNLALKPDGGELSSRELRFGQYVHC